MKRDRFAEKVRQLAVFAAILAVSCLVGPGLGEASARGSAGGFLNLFQNSQVYHIRSMEEAEEVLWEAAGKRASAVTLRTSASGPDLKSSTDQLQHLIYNSGVSQFSWSVSPNEVRLSSIVYNDHFGLCRTEDEIVNYINSCSGKGYSEFHVYVCTSLGEKLFPNERKKLEETLARSMLREPNRYSYYDFGYHIRFTDAVFMETDQETASLAEFIRIFGEHTDRLESEFTIKVSDGLYEQLFENIRIGTSDRSLISEIRANAGVVSHSYRHSGHNLIISGINYYEGKIILHAYRTGQADRLTPRQRETLQAALSLASQGTGTELERELRIHDELCKRIMYFTDEVDYNEDDCAIGALLNGKADCDGYADAFYLCGGLAGLEIGYVHGTAVDRSKDSETVVDRDSMHMWNLVRIGQVWTMTDVTWDDCENGFAHTYYNLGARQAQTTHIWERRAMRYPLAETTDNHQRNPELQQTEMPSLDLEGGQSAYTLLSAFSDRKANRICLSSSSVNFSNQHEKLSALLYGVGMRDYKWKLTPVAAEIFDIRYDENFRIFFSLSDVPGYIEELASGDIGSFTLYFAPNLREALFSNDCTMIRGTLAGTRLVEPESFVYGMDYGRVSFTNAAFYPASVQWKTITPGSVDELLSEIRSFAANRGKELLIDYSALGMNLYENSSVLSNALYSSGMTDFQWSFPGLSVRITDIQYPDCFAQISSLPEVKDVIDRYRNQGIYSFSLFFPQEKWQYLFENDHSELMRLFAETGIIEPWTFRYSTQARRIIFENVQFYQTSVRWEYASVSNLQEVQTAANDFAGKRGDVLLLDYSSGTDLYEKHEELSSILFSSGMKSFSWEFFYGIARISEIRY